MESTEIVLMSICRAGIEIEAQRTDLWMQPGEERGNWASSIERYISPYARQIASRRLLSDTGASTWSALTA